MKRLIIIILTRKKMKNIIKIASALMGAVLFMAQPIASNAAANGNIDENI